MKSSFLPKYEQKIVRISALCSEEHLTLKRNNFAVTKKFLITKFDCILKTDMALDLQKLGLIKKNI